MPSLDNYLGTIIQFRFWFNSAFCLHDPREKVSKKDLAIFSKSIYGLVPVFNSIDSALIDLTFDDKHQPSVKKFQRALQNNFKQTVRDKGLVYAMDTNYHKF